MININDLSYWEKTSYFEGIDFLVIGAGIVGYSTAIHLRKKYPNSKILVIERGYLPSGASSKNAGFTCFGSATELLDDLTQYDESTVWETVQKRWEGLSYLRELVGDSSLDLKLNGSWDIIKKGDEAIAGQVHDQMDYLNQKMLEITGEKNAFSEDALLNEKFGISGTFTSFNNRLEGQINTGKMNLAYLDLVHRSSIQVINGIDVSSIQEAPNEVCLLTNIGEIKAANVLVCTNGFAARLIEEDVKPARAQVIVTSVIPDLKLKGTFHFDRGYYYFRNIDGRILLGGGRNLDFEGETTTAMNTTVPIINALKQLLNDMIIPGKQYTIEHEWAGIMGVGNTKKPIVRKYSSRIGIGVRMGGMGVAIGTQVGKDLSSLF